MNKILTILGGLVTAFVLGFVALYVAMPSIAPEKVKQVNRHMDSVRITTGIDFGDDPLMVFDSLNTLRFHIDSLVTLGSFMQGSVDNQDRQITALHDSLRATRERLEAMEREHSEMLSLLDDVVARLRNTETQQSEIRNMSKTLSKMERRELQAIISSMDTNVLQRLYLEASDRERQAILGALSPERAAQLVRTMVDPQSQYLPPPVAFPPDSTSLGTGQ